jgi:hypothetical protein
MTLIRRTVRALLVVGMTAVFVFTATGVASAGWGYNTCWGTGGAIKAWGGANGGWIYLRCQQDRDTRTISADSPFRMRTPYGEACWNARTEANPGSSTWRAWTVSSCR